MKAKKGNILIVFIMLVGLSFMVFSIITVITTSVKDSGIRTSESQAFYVAEAGLNKAIWYLATPVAYGGKGSGWRGTATEYFAQGNYNISVQNTVVQGEVLIISVGSVKGVHKTIIQLVNTESFPAAFKYAIYCGNSGLSPTGDINISGDLFVNGNTTMVGNSSVTNGKVYHTEAYSVSGNAADGGVPIPIPLMPALDSSYYNGLIATAANVATGSRTYTNLNLNSGIVYVNGDVTITGTGSITGPGIVVATGQIKITGTPVSDGSKILFVSNGATEISGGAVLPNSTFYSTGDFKASGTTAVNVGSVITAADIKMTGSMDFTGLIYCSGTARLSGSPRISGSLVTNSFDKLTGAVRITYDPRALKVPPIGIERGKPNPIKGSWEEQ